MTITVSITCDNAAFEGENCGHEVARILREEVARVVEGLSHEDFPKLRLDRLADINGNAVGAFKVSQK